MSREAERGQPHAAARLRTDVYRQDSRTVLGVIGSCSALLALTLAGVLFGPGFDPASRDPVWAMLVWLILGALIGGCVWLLRRKPAVLRVGPAGLDLPIAFSRPLPWADIHRIRRLPPQRRLSGPAHWLVVDPAPGILPGYRLPTWRPLELWFQRRHGVRIPLHALDAAPEAVVASIERYRPVTDVVK